MQYMYTIMRKIYCNIHPYVCVCVCVKSYDTMTLTRHPIFQKLQKNEVK